MMKNKFEKKMDVIAAFSPSAPVDNRALFAGRIGQITTILNVVMQRGQHAIIYGERGVGKTSLANVIHDFITGRGRSIKVAKLNCDAEITLRSYGNQFSNGCPQFRFKGRSAFDLANSSLVSHSIRRLPTRAAPKIFGRPSSISTSLR